MYVNYGRIEDFTKLRDEYNITFTDSIVIARYGKIYRGDKVGMVECMFIGRQLVRRNSIGRSI